MNILVPEKWQDFELIDSGEGEKLERWGQYVISRPEPRAIWNKSDLTPWKNADAVHSGEQWKFKSNPPENWLISYGEIKFKLKPTDFKHTGVFPEQAVNWEWIREKLSVVSGQSSVKVLNLFAYTGGTTMAAALAGAQVTHVDSSKPAMMWASENATLSRVPKDKIRWIQEDAQKFVEREIRRGTKYDAIVMDPPKFGRGAGGEIWKLEEDLPKLVFESAKLLSDTPLFFLINAYASELSCVALDNLLSDALNREVESGEIGVKQTSNGKVMPAGIWARWSA